MQNNQKIIRLLLSAGAMILVIFIAITKERTENKNEPSTDVTSTVLTEFTQTTTYPETTTKIATVIVEYTAQNETEIVSEAPTDSSDWEIHEAADNEPDTGETIPE